MENRPENDYAKLTYPIEEEYLISKRRYSALQAIQYLQRNALITTSDVESALIDDTMPEDEDFMRRNIYH